MKVGNNEVTDILLGETPIVKVCRGEDVIWERGGLPSGYTRVEYLESTGTQWIDTGIYGSNLITVKTEIAFSSKDRIYQFPFGSRTTAGIDEFEVCLPYNLSYKMRSDFGETSNRIASTYTPQMNTFFTIYKNKEYCTFENVTVTHEERTFHNTQSIALFGTKYDTLVRPNETMIGKMKYFKIWDNDTLVRDFIPCLDNNNRPCMYDLVTRQPFYNQGTGEFLYA